MPPSAENTVPRIPAPSAEVFRREYLEAQRPVILTGLFAGQEIAAIRSEEDARTHLGWLRIPVASEYLSAVAKNEHLEKPETMRLDEYLDMERHAPGSLRMCSEQPTPALLLNRMKLPGYDAFDDTISSFFVGHRGRFAHMHFDGDYRHVLFHQIFGEKRFLFIPPDNNRLIPAIGNFVDWSFENMSGQEIEKTLAFAGGFDCTLRAGETLFIPASIWHYVGYSSTSMSLNLRFGRNAFTRFLAENVHMSKFAQAIAWKLGNEGAVTPELRAQYECIVKATEANYPSAEKRYIALDRLLEEVADAMYGETAPRSMRSSERLRALYRDGSIARYAAQMQAATREEVNA